MQFVIISFLRIVQVKVDFVYCKPTRHISKSGIGEIERGRDGGSELRGHIRVVNFVRVVLGDCFGFGER